MTARFGQVKLAIIAALDVNRAIGRANTLPWHLPNDLQRFKALTMGQMVVMGRRTAQSLGRALPGRDNCVLTSAPAAPFAHMTALPSLHAAMQRAAEHGRTWVWIIGGAGLYAHALPDAHALFLTHVATAVPDADAYFPVFEPRAWRCVAQEHHPVDDRHAYAFTFAQYGRSREPGTVVRANTDGAD